MFQNRAIKIIILIAICALCFVKPLSDLVEYLDREIFFLANSSLEFRPLQYFFGYLNHSYERKLNMVFVLGVSYLAYRYSEKKTATEQALNIACIFIGLQLWLAIINFIFSDILDIWRDSPSLVLPLKYDLSKILEDTNIKVISMHSFPGGHAFAASYWFLSLYRYSSYRIKIYSFVIAILMIIPRVFVGAHWFSDVLFSVWFAALAVQIDLYTNLWYAYQRVIKSLVKVIKWLRFSF